MSHDSERQQDKSKAMVAEGCQRSINEGGWRMIYSCKVCNKLVDVFNVSAERCLTYHCIAEFYIGDNLVAAFRDWSSIERLPSE